MGNEMDIGNINFQVTSMMIAIAMPISFAVQFIKAFTSRFDFFKADEIKKSFYPMLSIALTMCVYAICGISDWMIAGTIMGLSACGGYQAFSGTAGLTKKPVIATGIILLLCGTLIFGCNTINQDPKAELLAAQKTFSATIDSLTVLHKAGKIDAEDTQILTVLIHQGQDYLIAWEDAVKANQPKPDIVWEFQKVLDKLIEYQLEKEGGN